MKMLAFAEADLAAQLLLGSDCTTARHPLIPQTICVACKHGAAYMHLWHAQSQCKKTLTELEPQSNTVYG
jgi:hypothetical protein